MRSSLLFIPILIILTVATFIPVAHCGFVNFDDDQYVYANDHVQDGLTRDSIRWAFTTVHTGYWHPLTWLSLMADRQLLGPGPSGFHRTNAALHLLNVILLFLFLLYATHSGWRAALVAAFFAIHPLRVESVAWVSERKDVLTATFGLLTLLAYLRYTRDPGPRRYLPVLLLFALTLMAKPMLVTLPALLLLLDLWPLARWKPGMFPPAVGTTAMPLPVRPLRLLLLEKLPLLALSLGIALAAVVAQKRTGAMMTTADASLASRLGNVPVAYASYLGKLFWPTDLIIDYPLPAPPGWPLAAVIPSAVILLLVTFSALRAWRRFPHVVIGWMWFLGLLVPVIGLVQVGNQSMADRYTYLACVGVLIALVWSLPERLVATPLSRAGTAIVAAGLLFALHFLSVEQIAVWRDSRSLFGHAIAVDLEHAAAWNNLGVALQEHGEEGRARECFKRAVANNPRLVKPRINLGIAYEREGRTEAAMAEFRAAIALAPRRPEPLTALGMAMVSIGQHEAAIATFRDVIANAPNHALAWHQLANSFAALDRFTDALAAYDRAMELSPRDAQVICDRGLTLIRMTPPDPRRTMEARICLELALKIKPNLLDAHVALGRDDALAGRTDEAFKHFHRAVQISPDDYSANTALAVLARQAGLFDEALACYDRMLQAPPPGAVGGRPNPEGMAGPPPTSQTQILLEIGLTLGAAGRHDVARTFIEESLAQDPAFAPAHNALGIELAIAKSMEPAIAHFRKAVELAPENEAYRTNLRRALGSAPATQTAPATTAPD
ncbi:MAG: tetratricopeptide repeat protein [Planctomycetota bacterium]|nr:tetratricopeptide repeat protein [Planctomycetota bacterium]